ncbi:nuclear transport factor 2 family protein [uncultured Gilvimarinus sp.]|uniref:nuclear transport factor 2 family protein n=1 Tax=uncultured Gilvimarinus sp. TaxID=1689143 RepID=UPI0030EC0D37|tara:strand:+ start:613 stop:1017 length:405 start_codon:yes stop_codon:yes gene_type:complete
MGYFVNRLAVVVWLLCCSVTVLAAPLETLIEEQTRAYNNHDVSAYSGYFHPDVEVYNYPDHPITAGKGALIEATGKTFKERKPQAVVENVIVLGDKVVTLELASFSVGGARQSAKVIKIYQFQDGLIRRMTFMN